MFHGMYVPPNLHVAFGLAKMQEENVVALLRMARVEPDYLNSTHLLTTSSATPLDNCALVLVQRLSPTQMKERCNRGALLQL